MYMYTEYAMFFCFIETPLATNTHHGTFDLELFDLQGAVGGGPVVDILFTVTCLGKDTLFTIKINIYSNVF